MKSIMVETTTDEILDAILSEGEYVWRTEEYHADNNVTMGEFLEYGLPDDFDITLQDGTYAEISRDGFTYEVHASGAGDPYTHRVEFSLLLK